MGHRWDTFSAVAKRIALPLLSWVLLWFCRRLDRRPDEQAARSGIDLLFADEPAAKRERIVRDYRRFWSLDHVIWKALPRHPRLTRFLARFVLIDARPDARALLSSPRPIIFAIVHTGGPPLFLPALLRLTRPRSLFLHHAEPNVFWLERATALAKTMGVEVIGGDLSSIRRMASLLRSKTKTGVLLFFDSFAYGDGMAELFGKTVTFADGFLRFAERYSPIIIPGYTDLTGVLPKLVMSSPFPDGENVEQQRKRLAAYVEERLRKVPAHWTEWPNVVASHERAQRIALRAANDATRRSDQSATG